MSVNQDMTPHRESHAYQAFEDQPISRIHAEVGIALIRGPAILSAGVREHFPGTAGRPSAADAHEADEAPDEQRPKGIV